jgi:protein ImuB
MEHPTQTAQWLALHLPLLPLEAFCATLAPEDRHRPVALVADHRVRGVNRAAAECGVRAGLKQATAQALSAELLLAAAEPARDAAALQAVAHAALAFTPAVAFHDAQTVLLEVQASLRLFGGLAALRQRLQAQLAPLGHRVQMAAAPTALGAVLLAQWHPADRGDLVLGAHATGLPLLRRLLDAAPVWLLGPGREHWEALQGMGLKTLSDLRSLPRSGVARRFGVELLTELSQAYGEQPDPRQWTALPPEFESRLELFTRAEHTEQVLQGAQVLLARLVAWAQARQVRVAAFTLRMLHERQHRALQAPTELVVELAEPALDAAHLQLLLRERLGRLPLAAPTLELQLHCSQIRAAPAPNGELFPTRASATEGLTRLLERLRARLGDAQVQRLVAVADHRPERASVVVPVQTLPATLAAAPSSVAPSPAAELHGVQLRPTWLLPEPLPLAERDAQPLLQGRPLQLLSGPERIETGWWDGAPIARDYYIAMAEDRSLLWLFRSRLPVLPGEVNWFLQGRFG